MARIPQIAGKADVPEAQQYVVDQVLEVFGRVRGPFSVLLHSPALAERLLPMVPFNREMTVVDAPLRLVGILATVREKDANYVWAAQVRSARENGVSEATIDVLRAKGDVDALPAEQRDVATYARQLARTNRVDQSVFDTLLKRHGTKWLVELTAIMIFYGALSGVVKDVKLFVGLVQALVPFSSATEARMSSPAVEGLTLGVAPVAPFAVKSDDILSSVNGPPVHSATRIPRDGSQQAMTGARPARAAHSRTRHSHSRSTPSSETSAASRIEYTRPSRSTR